MSVVKVTFKSLGKTTRKIGFNGAANGPELWRCSLCCAVVEGRKDHVGWHETLLHAPSA